MTPKSIAQHGTETVQRSLYGCTYLRFATDLFRARSRIEQLVFENRLAVLPGFIE
jgi:hypothetical protein